MRRRGRGWGEWSSLASGPGVLVAFPLGQESFQLVYRWAHVPGDVQIGFWDFFGANGARGGRCWYESSLPGATGLGGLGGFAGLGDSCGELAGATGSGLRRFGGLGGFLGCGSSGNHGD